MEWIALATPLLPGDKQPPAIDMLGDCHAITSNYIFKVPSFWVGKDPINFATANSTFGVIFTDVP
jgi:hypothetical protein